MGHPNRIRITLLVFHIIQAFFFGLSCIFGFVALGFLARDRSNSSSSDCDSSSYYYSYRCDYDSVSSFDLAAVSVASVCYLAIFIISVTQAVACGRNRALVRPGWVKRGAIWNTVTFILNVVATALLTAQVVVSYAGSDFGSVVSVISGWISVLPSLVVMILGFVLYGILPAGTALDVEAANANSTGPNMTNGQQQVPMVHNGGVQPPQVMDPNAQAQQQQPYYPDQSQTYQPAETQPQYAQGSSSQLSDQHSNAYHPQAFNGMMSSSDVDRSLPQAGPSGTATGTGTSANAA